MMQLPIIKEHVNYMDNFYASIELAKDMLRYIDENILWSESRGIPAKNFKVTDCNQIRNFIDRLDQIVF